MPRAFVREQSGPHLILFLKMLQVSSGYFRAALGCRGRLYSLIKQISMREVYGLGIHFGFSCSRLDICGHTEQGYAGTVCRPFHIDRLHSKRAL